MTTDSSSTMDVLAEDECLQLLATQDVGRIAVVLGRQPFIVPVHYVLDGDRKTHTPARAGSTPPARATTAGSGRAAPASGTPPTPAD